MNNSQYNQIRLTDSMERQLIQEAILSQNEYALDYALRNLFAKAFSLFKGRNAEVRQDVSLAS